MCGPAAAQVSPQAANLFWATPSSGTGYLGLRAIATSDLPTFATNSFALSILAQIPAKAVLGNATASTGNVTSPWTVPNITDTVIPLVHGALVTGDSVCLNDTAGTLADCGTVGANVTPIQGSASAVSMTTATSKTITSVSLTVGTWACNGSMRFIGGTGAVQTNEAGGISATTNVLPSSPYYFQSQETTSAATAFAAAVPQQIITVASTTTYYLVGNVAFSGGTATADGAMSCVLNH
jgi:hypothetical protein